MTRELNWYFDHNHALLDSGSYVFLTQALLYYLKNKLVAEGGWTVVGSSGGGNWEYEGDTGGGPYGGGSTNSYDVWEDSADIQFATDGNNPGWVVLKGPTWEGATPYLILSYTGSSGTYAYCAGCGEKPELVSGAAAYTPVAPAGDIEFVEWVGTRWFAYTGNFRTQLSICTDNGSFILLLDREGYTGFNGILAFVRVDPNAVRPTFALASGSGTNDPFASIYVQWWKAWCPTPQPWGDDISPLIVDQIAVTWGDPVRRTGTAVMSTDLNTVNCFSKAEPFPFFLVVTPTVSNIEYKLGTLGRVPDLWVAPRGLAEGDTVGDGGSVEYYVCGNWLIPGDTTPVIW